MYVCKRTKCFFINKVTNFHFNRKAYFTYNQLLNILCVYIF